MVGARTGGACATREVLSQRAPALAGGAAFEFPGGPLFAWSAKGGALDSSFSASGNATNDGFNTLIYDAENHAVSVSNTSASATYTYDANGLRVQKAVTGGTTTVYIFSGSKVIAEYDNGAAVGSPSREYIYSGGALLAKIESGATVYYHQDGLSARVMTDSSGNKLTPGDQGHYPFGELWYPSSALTKWLFTTYERDSESGGNAGNDYAMARYYRDALGRLNSPDPLSGSIGDPQSLNRYSYSRNEPIDLTDPSGACYEEGWGGALASVLGAHGVKTLCGPDVGRVLLGYLVDIQYASYLVGTPGPGDSFTWSVLINVTASASPVYGLALPNGPTGAGAQAMYTVNLKVLNDCLKSLGIKTTINSFTPSTPGGYGSASGVGEDAFSHGGNTVPITVTNDAHSKNVAQVSALCRVPAAYGCTLPWQPYTDYTNNNNDAYGTVRTQVWELGNSLFYIQAGSPFIPMTKGEEGKLLDNCVTSHNGIQRQ